jgi:hypothetical protein
MVGEPPDNGKKASGGWKEVVGYFSDLGLNVWMWMEPDGWMVMRFMVKLEVIRWKNNYQKGWQLIEAC